MGSRLRHIVIGCAAALALVGAGCDVGGSDDEPDAAAQTTTETTEAVSTAQCRSAGQGAGSGPSFALPKIFLVSRWRLERSNLHEAVGCLRLDGEPVTGARIRVNNYLVPRSTDENGGFRYPIDATLPNRAVVRVADASGAQVGGEALASGDRQALLEAEGALTVRYKLGDVAARKREDGNLIVTGKATFDDGRPPPPVVLFAFQLSGRVTDARGRPVRGALISTRTLDAGSWSLSEPSRADGSYTSYFYPSAEGDEDVGFVVRIAVGDATYELLEGEIVFFEQLQSAVMDVQLPPRGYPMALPSARSIQGAVFEGLLVGATVDGTPVRPLEARWVDRRGNFQFVLPARLAGRTVSLWESSLYAFSANEARPGGAVDLSAYPRRLPLTAPRDLETLKLPS